MTSIGTRRRLLPALLLLAASTSSAGTLNLRWTDCLGDGGVANRAFACDRNTGSNVLVGSFVLPAPHTFTTGEEIVVDIATAGASLSPWWDFRNVGACRQFALSISFSPTATALQCIDWSATAGGLMSYSHAAFFGPNTVRLIAAAAVPGETSEDLVASQEYFSFTIVISDIKTVGTGSCAGCLTPACLGFNSMKLSSLVQGNNEVFTPGPALAQLTDAVATWQGGAGAAIPYPFGGLACPRPTSTRASTWGSVKALYR
jgi:hypothetical protein